MLTPGEATLIVYRGGTFELPVTLEKTSPKEAYNLTGFKVEVVIQNFKTLTEGSGVTIINKAKGEFEIVLTAEQTAEILKNEEREYYVKLTKEAGGQVWIALKGNMRFVYP